MNGFDIHEIVIFIGALPEKFQQNPVGALIFAGLVVMALGSWVAVTWIQHKR